MGLREKLSYLKYHRGQAVLDHWNGLIAAGDQVALCRALAADHYDPAYEKSMAAVAPNVVARCSADSLSPRALEHLADQVAQAVQTISI